MVVGKAIPVHRASPSDPEAFNAAVNKAHQDLMEQLQYLYDKYKVVYGWENRPMVME
jgi:hypothetical protein